MDHRETTYVGPLEDFAFTVDPRVQRDFLEAVQDPHSRYADGEHPIVHPGVLLSHSNATRSPSFGGPNTGWIHARDQTRFLNRAYVGEPLLVRWQVAGHQRRFGHVVTEVTCTVTGDHDRAVLRRRMWGIRGTADRRLPHRTGAARTSRVLPAEAPKFAGAAKTLTAERIHLFSGWLNRNIHNDDRVARGAGLMAAVASATQGMAYLCEVMIENFGPVWLDTGTCDLTFRKPIFVGDVVVAQGSVERRGPACRSTVGLRLINQFGIVVTAGTAECHEISVMPVNGQDD
jgi:acyl dehydratase